MLKHVRWPCVTNILYTFWSNFLNVLQTGLSPQVNNPNVWGLSDGFLRVEQSG